MILSRMNVSLLMFALLSLFLHTQSHSAPVPSESDLSQKVVDPTASLMTIGLKYNHINGFHGNSSESANLVQIQPVIPFEAFGVPNILRITATGTIDGPRGSGFNDVAVFNLFIINEPWGRWGFGPVMDFIHDPAPGGDSFTAGPAIGAVLNRGKWTYGAFNQNFIGSNTELSSIQPVLAYQLGSGYSLSAGEAQFTYDWRNSQWVNLPVGLALNKVTQIHGQPIKLSVNPEYNFREVAGTAQFTIRFGMSLIF